MSERPELIVCAAVRFEEFHNFLGTSAELIIPMVRHYSKEGNIIIDAIDEREGYSNLKEIEQGFITNFGRFVNRKEALEIAKANNQIKFDIGYEPDELYSEMLY